MHQLDSLKQTSSSKPYLIACDIFFLLLAAYFTKYPWIGFPWRLPVMALVVTVYTLWRTGSLASMGFKLRHTLVSTLLWSVGLTLFINVGIGMVFQPWLERVLNEPTNYEAYGALKGNFAAAFQLWWMAMLSAAIAEEVVFRGFLFSILERLLGSSAWQKALIVLLGAVLFGVAHAAQGLSGIISTGAVALVFGAAFYASNRNLPALMLAHALVDTWGIYSLYTGSF